MSAPLLSLRGVACGYRTRTVLSGIHLEVATGSVLGIVGGNATGKTTLFRALCGEGAWIRGEIEWRGQRVAHLRDPAVPFDDVAWVRQERPVFPGLSVREALEVVQRRTKGGDADLLADLRAASPLRNGILDRRMEVLSGGERALVSFALGLVNHPRLLLLDEPAANLSTETQQVVKGFLKSLLTQQGIGCVIIEHRYTFLEDLTATIVDISNFPAQTKH